MRSSLRDGDEMSQGGGNRQHRRRLFWPSVLVLGVLATGACGGGSSNSGAGSSTKLEKTTLNVNWSKFAANDAGYRLAEFAKKQGLE